MATEQHDEDKGDALGSGVVDDTTKDESGEVGNTEDTLDGGTGEDTVAGGEAKDHMIPKTRFDEAVNKARREAATAQARVEQLEAEAKAGKGSADTKAVEEQIDSLDDKLYKARADGDAEEVKRIRAEIRDLQNQLIDSVATARAQMATAVAVEQTRYDNLVEQMEKDHPELNPDGDAYDEAKVGEVMELKTAFEATGQSSSAALKKAVGIVYKAAPAAKKVEEPSGELDKAKKAAKEAEERKEAAIKAARDAAAKQGKPPIKGAGKDSDAAGKSGTGADVAKMSDSEFSRLTKEEKARARGDIL